MARINALAFQPQRPAISGEFKALFQIAACKRQFARRATKAENLPAQAFGVVLQINNESFSPREPSKARVSWGSHSNVPPLATLSWVCWLQATPLLSAL